MSLEPSSFCTKSSVGDIVQTELGNDAVHFSQSLIPSHHREGVGLALSLRFGRHVRPRSRDPGRGRGLLVSCPKACDPPSTVLQSTWNSTCRGHSRLMEQNLSSTLYKMRRAPGTSPPYCRMTDSTPTILQRGQRCPLQHTLAPSWRPFKVSLAHPLGAKPNACSSEPCWPTDDAPSRPPCDTRGRAIPRRSVSTIRCSIVLAGPLSKAVAVCYPCWCRPSMPLAAASRSSLTKRWSDAGADASTSAVITATRWLPAASAPSAPVAFAGSC